MGFHFFTIVGTIKKKIWTILLSYRKDQNNAEKDSSIFQSRSARFSSEINTTTNIDVQSENPSSSCSEPTTTAASIFPKSLTLVRTAYNASIASSSSRSVSDFWLPTFPNHHSDNKFKSTRATKKLSRNWCPLKTLKKLITTW